MLLVAGSPSLRRAALDQLAGQRIAGATRRPRRPTAATLQQRNGLLRAIREETAPRATSCGSGTATFLDAGGADRRRAAARSWSASPSPLAARPRRDRARRGGRGAARPALRDERAGRRRRDATGRAGATPRRDRREGGLERATLDRAAPRRPRRSSSAGRDLAGFASRGQQRTAILALKLAELDLLTDARRPAAAPPPRRRLHRARSGPPRATSSGGSPRCPRRS